MSLALCAAVAFKSLIWIQIYRIYAALMTSSVHRVKKTKVGQSNLRAMLETETEPAIGLQYVVELFPESNESGKFTL